MVEQPRVLMDGLGLPESTRWHDGRIWFCNWGSGEVVTVDPATGDTAVAARLAASALPFSIDWLPDGRLLIIDGPGRKLLRQEPDGSLHLHADLTGFGTSPFNELVVGAGGDAYINGGSGVVVLAGPDGAVRQVADGFEWPNGMALLEDGRTLVVADSHTRELVGYDVGHDGGLSGRRIWAGVDTAPDGICVDAEGAIWFASVPGRGCTRVREGGEILSRVTTDRGAFACMLGGPDGRTLFVAAAEWRGMEVTMREGPGRSGQLLAIPGSPAARAGRP